MWLPARAKEGSPTAAIRVHPERRSRKHRKYVTLFGCLFFFAGPGGTSNRVLREFRRIRVTEEGAIPGGAGRPGSRAGNKVCYHTEAAGRALLTPLL